MQSHMTLAGDPVNHSGKVTSMWRRRTMTSTTTCTRSICLLKYSHATRYIPASCFSVFTSIQIPVVLLAPLLSRKALPLESFLLPPFPDVRLSLASSLPFSKMCSMTSMSLLVPNTVSSSCFEGRSRRPCGPWFDEKMLNAVVNNPMRPHGD